MIEKVNFKKILLIAFILFATYQVADFSKINFESVIRGLTGIFLTILAILLVFAKMESKKFNFSSNWIHIVLVGILSVSNLILEYQKILSN